MMYIRRSEASDKSMRPEVPTLVLCLVFSIVVILVPVQATRKKIARQEVSGDVFRKQWVSGNSTARLPGAG